ncbi:MAG: GNAT family N-acetyltransferase [Acidimicrobiales bacterium]
MTKRLTPIKAPGGASVPAAALPTAAYNDGAMTEINELGQPIGDLLSGWSARQAPPGRVLQGRWCRLEPVDRDRHAGDLYRANGRDGSGRMWTYLPYGPFTGLGSYAEWMEQVACGDGALFFAVVTAGDEHATGVLALQRVDVWSGSAEVGHIAFSPELQGTTAATEAIFLVMSLVFDELGYRRFEWKCDALNAASRIAAERFGFVYEGTFRQAVVVKGRNRDTAWFSIVDSEWPGLKGVYERWLSPGNFEEGGKQRLALSQLTGREPPSSGSARAASRVDITG